jgi:4a-hydroxytetrahydrobiopterin dehydratase
MNNPLDRAAIIAGLKDKQGWELTPKDASFQVIEKTYFFQDFNAAFGFMGRVALIAERANHHPELHNQYREVTVRWATHSCGGITALDLEMAKICDQLAVDSGLKA